MPGGIGADDGLSPEVRTAQGTAGGATDRPEDATLLGVVIAPPVLQRLPRGRRESTTTISDAVSGGDTAAPRGLPDRVEDPLDGHAVPERRGRGHGRAVERRLDQMVHQTHEG